MKKYVVCLLLFYAGALFSQTYYLNIWSNGTVTSIPVQEIRKITFQDVADKIGKEAEIAVIQTFRLLQNYPNPFNPCTTIEYQIPEGGKVSVSIFSLNGNLLKTIERTHAAPGTYTVEWDGKDAAGQTSASGFYIYRVSYSHSVIAKKMLLLK